MTADFPHLDALQTSCQRANAAGASVDQMSAFSARRKIERIHETRFKYRSEVHSASIRLDFPPKGRIGVAVGGRTSYAAHMAMACLAVCGASGGASVNADAPRTIGAQRHVDRSYRNLPEVQACLDQGQRPTEIRVAAKVCDHWQAG